VHRGPVLGPPAPPELAALYLKTSTGAKASLEPCFARWAGSLAGVFSLRASTCGHDRASPKKSSPKIAFNRRTLYRESQETPISSPRLVSPITLRLALTEPQREPG
jgi:hypothetical protein